MTYTDPAVMWQVLDTAEYPCTRAELVRHAAAEGAGDQVIGDLCTLPDIVFESSGSVRESFGRCA